MIYEALNYIYEHAQVITQREAPEALFLLWNGTGVVLEKRVAIEASRAVAQLRAEDSDLVHPTLHPRLCLGLSSLR